jgi:hypothetical protein
MEDTSKVKFGGVDREVRPFNLANLRKVLPAFQEFFDAMARQDHGAALNAAEKIVPPALGLTDEEFAGTGTDFVEIWGVVQAAAEATGLKKLGEHLTATPLPAPPDGTTSLPSS